MGATCCKQIPTLLSNEYEVMTIANWDGENIVKKSSDMFDIRNSGLVERNVINYVQFMTDPEIKPPKSTYYKKQAPDYTKPVFEDNIFPPREESIIFIDKTKSVSSCITAEDTEPLKNLTWQRPKDMFKNGKYVIYEKIDIEDIHQGVLGNCYFLSSLSAIAENPTRLAKLLDKSKVNPNGCYEICIYIQGKKKIIVLDDYFPVYKDKKSGKLKWAMATSGEGEIWVQLFEKLWAKVNQSYTMTIAGLPSEALSTLTEAPVITYIHKKYDPQDLWKIIKFCDDENYIICTSTNNSTASQEVGLVQSHAYTIVSAYDIKGLKLLKIRNPWGGGFEWNGDFGDKSDKWTPDLKKMVNFQAGNDGIFYMTFNDFLKYYPYTFVCKYYDNWNYKFKKLEQKENDTLLGLRFKVEKKTKVIIGLHQKQERFYNKVPNYKPCYCKLFLVKVEGDHYTYIQSNEGSTDKIYLDLQKPLEPGNYYIFGKTTWNYFKYDTCKVVFSMYTEDPSLDFFPIDRKLIKQDYITRIFDSFIAQFCQYKPASEKGLSYVSSLADTDTGFFWLSFKNNNHEDSCKVSFFVQTNDNLSLLSKNVKIEKIHNKNLITIDVSPSSQEIVLFEQLDNVWLCKISISQLEIQWESGAYNPEEDRKFISESLKENNGEALIGSDVYYSKIKKGNYILIVFQNESNFDYMLKILLKDMLNCSIAYPISVNSTNIKLHGKSIEFMKIVPDSIDIIDFKLTYSYKNLSKGEDLTTRAMTTK